MKIYVTLNGQREGPFTPTQVRTKIRDGDLALTDLAQAEGETQWRPLEVVLEDAETGAAIHSATMKRTWRKVAIFLLCLIVGVALFSLAFPQYCLITKQANQMKAASNCKQVIGLLMAFASENCGLYPDTVTDEVRQRRNSTGGADGGSGDRVSCIVPRTSNEAFRMLFREGLTQDETIFGCPASKYQADGNIGAGPTFDEALTPSENHWAMTAGQSNTSTSIMPLVFENPIAAGWPPQWNADAAGKPTQGRAWSGGKIIIGKIIIGKNDGSVATVKLQSSKGQAVGPRVTKSGLDMFRQASGNQPLQILNIAVGGGQS